MKNVAAHFSCVLSLIYVVVCIGGIGFSAPLSPLVEKKKYFAVIAVFAIGINPSLR